MTRKNRVPNGKMIITTNISRRVRITLTRTNTGMIRRRTDRASVLSGRALPATGRAIALKTGTAGARSDRTTEPAPSGTVVRPSRRQVR